MAFKPQLFFIITYFLALSLALALPENRASPADIHSRDLGGSQDHEKRDAVDPGTLSWPTSDGPNLHVRSPGHEFNRGPGAGGCAGGSCYGTPHRK